MNEMKARSAGASLISSHDLPCPPFHVWVKAGVLLVLVIGGSFLYNLTSCACPPSCFNAERLTELETDHRSARLRVVALGTSMMRCALYWDNDLDRLVHDSGSGEWSFIRFTRNGAVLKDYNRLCREILHSKPDVVVFEDALFILGSRSAPGLMAQHRLFLKNGVKVLLYYAYSPLKVLFADAENWGPHPEPHIVCMQGPEDFEQYRHGVLQFQARPLEDSRLLGDFLRQARARGIRIVFLRIPRSPDAESVFPDFLRQSNEKVLQQYREVYGVETLRYPQELPMRCYRDFGHMGPEGQKVFSTWFVRELSERFHPDRPVNQDDPPRP